MPDVEWTTELAEQLDFQWQHALRPGLAGLTDEEYLWEPVAGCWSLRPRGQATTAMAAGAGDVVADFEHPEPVPPPVTTIAWRLGHIAVGCLGARATSHFGASFPDYPGTNWSLTAAGGLDLLDRAYAAWIGGVRALTAAQLAEPCGPAEGPYAAYPMAGLVLHINREVLHHGAEVMLLRDLYRNRSTLRPG